MFNIRKIQEQVIFDAVIIASNEETAAIVVYGKNGISLPEDNAAWVQSTMSRLENSFDGVAEKQVRMNCQCGYGMDEKLALVKELVESSSNLEKFAGQDKAKAAGLSCINGELYLQFVFCPCPI